MAAVVDNVMSRTIGRFGKGNIDLYNRPTVEADGGIATVRSMSFQDQDGKEVLIPTVSRSGLLMNQEQAIDNYYKTGEYLGKFNTVKEAEVYGNRLHLQQQRYYKNIIKEYNQKALSEGLIRWQ